MTATQTAQTSAQPATSFDPAKAEAFGGQLNALLGGGLLSLMVDIGYRTGCSPRPPGAGPPASSSPRGRG